MMTADGGFVHVVRVHCSFIGRWEIARGARNGAGLVGINLQPPPHAMAEM
jgi:hypothetical protein